MAARIDKNESLLQQRGPPISPICSSELAVILCDSANGSFSKGVDFEMMEINIPELIPAPQAPPEAASTTWNALPSIQYFYQCAMKVDISACVFIRRQQGRTYHDMVFRTVHMTEWHSHHLFNDINWIP